jgi:hypothetical protein
MFWKVVVLVNVLTELKISHRWTDWNLSTESPRVARPKDLFIVPKEETVNQPEA